MFSKKANNPNSDDELSVYLRALANKTKQLQTNVDDEQETNQVIDSPFLRKTRQLSAETKAVRMQEHSVSDAMRRLSEFEKKYRHESPPSSSISLSDNDGYSSSRVMLSGMQPSNDSLMHAAQTTVQSPPISPSEKLMQSTHGPFGVNNKTQNENDKSDHYSKTKDYVSTSVTSVGHVLEADTLPHTMKQEYLENRTSSPGSQISSEYSEVQQKVFNASDLWERQPEGSSSEANMPITKSAVVEKASEDRHVVSSSPSIVTELVSQSLHDKLTDRSIGSNSDITSSSKPIVDINDLHFASELSSSSHTLDALHQIPITEVIHESSKATAGESKSSSKSSNVKIEEQSKHVPASESSSTVIPDLSIPVIKESVQKLHHASVSSSRSARRESERNRHVDASVQTHLHLEGLTPSFPFMAFMPTLQDEESGTSQTRKLLLQQLYLTQHFMDHHTEMYHKYIAIADSLARHHQSTKD